MSASRVKTSQRTGAVTPRAEDAESCCGGTQGDAAEAEGSELRCACGSLLARYVDGKVELKCRRCKRTIWIAVSGEGERDA